MLRMGSLFSGVGGLELGLEQAGVGEIEWQVEIDAWCRAVLARRWPHANRSVVDVCKAGRATLPSVDLICGGFPCQDVSSAGLGEGLEGARSGLWYEYRRIVTELRPRCVVVENVASGKGRWLCEVLGDLQGAWLPNPRPGGCRARPWSASPSRARLRPRSGRRRLRRATGAGRTGAPATGARSSRGRARRAYRRSRGRSGRRRGGGTSRGRGTGTISRRRSFGRARNRRSTRGGSKR